MATRSALISGYAPRLFRPLFSYGEERGDGPSSSEVQQARAKAVPKRVAVVDDEEDLIAVYRLMLARMGAQIECAASDGDEIVQAVKDGKAHPDVIIMDYRMPRMGGLEAAERIRQVAPSTRIVIATADDSAKQRVLTAGFEYIQKPFSMGELRAYFAALGSA